MKILDDSGYPMMSEKEVGIIESLIEKHRPQFCLEWGSGNSTVYFSTKYEFIQRWDALEHTRAYLELLGDKLPKERAIIHLVTEMDKYIKFPLSQPWQYDFIFIDGQWRDECVEVALQIAKPGAIVLLHDCSRIESAKIMEKYKDRIEVLSEGEQMTSNGYYAHRGLALFKV